MSALSAPPTPGKIRDPVHGYIAFTAIERAILDHPVAQRLRYIGQSAAAHLVFPEMRVSRMAHSLGAMHLASRFLDAAVSNAGKPQRTTILDGCHALVKRHEGLGLGPALDNELFGQGLMLGRSHDGDDRRTMLLVEQGLRLASLVHDLGHLPFSHDFEEALEDHWRAHPEAQAIAANLVEQGRGGDAVHERIGYAIANVVQRDVFNDRLANGPLTKPAEVALLIARDILNAPAEPQLKAEGDAIVLSWLHSLVAGEIDVDRADYVLRDGRHYGLAAAGYDLDRLVDHLIPIEREDGRLETAVLAQGVSAVESFLLARFRMYTWAVYHHKIQQAAAGLRVAIVDLLGSGQASLSTFVEDIDAIAGGSASQDALDRFVDYDDGWWIGLMRERLRQGSGSDVEPWLALFLRRRPGPISLWKRPADFPVEDRVAWNRRLPQRDDFELLAKWQEIRTALRREGVLLERLPFRPWRTDANGESSLQACVGNATMPLTRLSSLVRALDGAWADELQIFAFVDAENKSAHGPAAVLQRLEPALQP